MKRNRNNDNGPKKTITRKRAQNGTRETPISAVMYRGPISTPGMRQASDLHTFVLVNNGQLVSNVGGIIATVFDNTAQAAASPDWAGLSGLFKEWRILATEIRFNPWSQYSKATTIIPPVYVIIDRTTATALTSVLDALASTTCRQKSLENPWSIITRMNSIEEAVWTPSGSSLAANAKQYVKLYTSGLTPSTTFGDFITYSVVQFRSL